jgi:hypothetical protein
VKVNAPESKAFSAAVDTIAEFEALMALVKRVTDLAQHEKVYIGAYRQFISRELESQLDVTESDGIPVVDVQNITQSTKLPRVIKEHYDFTAVGQEAWERAVDESLHRNDLKGARLDEGDMLKTVLDLRLIYMQHFSDAERTEAFKVAKIAYVKFGLQKAKYLETDAQKSPMNTTLPVTPQNTANRFMLGANPYLSPNDAAPALQTSIVKSALEAEFDTVIEKWKRMTVDWYEHFPDLELSANVKVWKAILQTTMPEDPEGSGREEAEKLRSAQSEATERLQEAYNLHPVDDLLKLDMAPFYEALDAEGHYGLLPKMALANLGRSVSESYCERMGSISNQVMDEGTTLLSDSLLEKIVVMRMNKKLMKYLRTKYPQLMRRAAAARMNDMVDKHTMNKQVRSKKQGLLNFSSPSPSAPAPRARSGSI